jgi:hypothetical protein
MFGCTAKLMPLQQADRDEQQPPTPAVSVALRASVYDPDSADSTFWLNMLQG